MKFIVSSAVLKRAVAFVLRAVKVKPTYPVLENIHFSITEGVMTLKASDNIETMITTCPVDSATEGLFLLPAVKLNQLLGVLPEQPLTITIDDTTFGHTIKWETGKSKLSGENPVDFPKLKESTGKVITLSFDGDDRASFITALSNTVFCTSNDDLRPAMTGVHLHSKIDSLVAVATNGWIMVKYPLHIPEGEGVPSCIVPAKYIKSFLTVVNDVEGPIELTLTATNIKITIGNYTLIGRLIDERYPDYENAIPKNNTFLLQVDKSTLAESVRRMMITVDYSKTIRFCLSKSKLTLISTDIDFSNESDEALLADYQGDPMEIGFNGDRLLKILPHIPGQRVNISLSAPNRATLIWGDDESITTLLMPEPIMSRA